MRHTATADLPRHGGRAPAWRWERMLRRAKVGEPDRLAALRRLAAGG